MLWRLRNMRNIWVLLRLGLVFCLATFIGCATYQPVKPRVILHPMEYENSVNTEGISVAAIPFNPQRSMYADPRDTNPRKPAYNLLEAGVCPVRLVFLNESNQPYFVDPAQITCGDIGGRTYQPFGEAEAGDTIVASQAFKSWVKGAVAGTIVGAIIGAGVGAAVGGAIGGQDHARNGAVIGGVIGGATGGAEGGMAFQMQMERRIRLTLARNHLRAFTLSPGARHEGIVLCPAVELGKIQILFEDPEYQWSQLVDVPIAAPGSVTNP